MKNIWFGLFFIFLFSSCTRSIRLTQNSMGVNEKVGLIVLDTDTLKARMGDKIYKAMRLKKGSRGFIVVYVFDNSPAEKAGLTKEDIITIIDGKALNGYKDIENIAEGKHTFVVIRKGKIDTIALDIAEDREFLKVEESTSHIFKTGRKWEYNAVFLSSKGDTTDTQSIILKVPGGNFYGQIRIKWIYNIIWEGEKMKGEGVATTEISGVIENKNTVFMHPPRNGNFKFAELAPFPEIYFSKKKWSGTMKIEGGWGKWKGWEIICHYKIVGKEDIKTLAGVFKGCWRVDSKAESKEGGVYKLTTYFHPEYGFVKWIYTKPDSEKVIFELEKFEEGK